MDTKAIDTGGAVAIAPGIWWVGFEDQGAGLHCNPYVLDAGEEAVLIEPGSVPHFPIVYEKVRSVIPLEKINYILVSHQDPDLCAAIPLFEKEIGHPLQIVTHSRAAILIAHYGLQNGFYHVDQNDWQLTLKGGRVLRFIFTPYLHFPGMFMTWDAQSQILFSGDLFGAFSFDWHLFANPYYAEAMKAFHENYMPSREILAMAMDKIKDLPIKLIAPQHGSIIDHDIPRFIQTLRELDCGDYLLV